MTHSRHSLPARWALTLTLFLYACPAILAGQTDRSDWINVTDYLTPDTAQDLADRIQEIIDENPNRTIFFPDGTYLLSHSILTPADPEHSVHLVLSNYAVLKATEDWQGDALVRLGGKMPFNTIYVNGSNYGIEGGIFDGSGKADGISIDSGRETRITRSSIKNTQTGIHIRYGANSGSSDSDISDVNIVGNKDSKSIGVLIEGYDNTLTNMRIAGINTGIWCKTGGNVLRSIHPLTGADYPNSCAFIVEQGNNYLDHCYSDQFAVAFRLSKGIVSHFNVCWAWWYNGKVDSQTAIECDGPLESYFWGFRTGFSNGDGTYCILKADKGGKGGFQATNFPRRELSKEDVSQEYLRP